MTPQHPLAAGLIVDRAPAPQPPRNLASLATDSHRDGVREVIRRAIRGGTIRVRPWPGDPERVRIIPVHVIDG